MLRRLLERSCGAEEQPHGYGPRKVAHARASAKQKIGILCSTIL